MNFRILTGCLLSLAVLPAQAQTAFTYQGSLSENGALANDSFDLRFTLHDAPAAGAQVGNPITQSPVGVTNGLFAVTLDFGAGVFNGEPRWLQIGVRPFGSAGQYSILSPRQPVTAAPYAIRALSAENASGVAATNLTGIVPDARLSTNVALLGSNVFFRASVTATQFNGSGAGLINLPAENLTGLLPDARLSTNVARLDSNANFAGTVSAPAFIGNGTGLTNVPGRIFEVVPTGANIQALANTGYLATNDTSTVVVTLPSTPAIRVGETVRVSASGAGGWSVAQNAGQSILISGLLSEVGITWTPRENSRPWRDIASSVDGRKLVAVASNGQIVTSTNYGATWTLRTFAPGNQNWSCVASSGDGSKLVAGVNGAFIYTSTDSGASWTPRFGNLSWDSVASSLDGTKLVATTAGAGSIYTSVNSGLNWTARLGTANWSSVASSADGVYLVACIQGGMIYTSTNSGLNWGPHDSNRAWVSVASSADGSQLIAAVNNGELYRSTDFGTNWFAVGPGVPQVWSAVASSGDGARLAAVINGGGIYTSSDSGVTWSQRSGLPISGWTTVASSDDGTTLAAAGVTTQIHVSSQAVTTTGTAGGLSGSRLSAVELEHVGNGVFMPISFVGTIRAK